MITLALLPIALALGWLGTLILSRDLANVEFKDFVIATAGASFVVLLGPQLGIDVLGEQGVRLVAILPMILAAVLSLAVANLLRGRGVRCGIRHGARLSRS
jgi:uncharacterized membrane protein YeaQ/YmgE (transglycosylase-associated protein family)